MTHYNQRKEIMNHLACIVLPCLLSLLWIESVQAQRSLRNIPEPDIANELASFTVADGFEISLFASTPMLGKPTQINFDREGRLWVASSQIYPQLKANQDASDGIIILEDNDGDGVADTSSIFYDELIIPGGVLPDGRGGAYVAHGENLIQLSDDDGDGRADRKTILLSGFGSEDTHHTLHRLHWGPGGLLYMLQGYYIGTHVETLYGPRRLNGGGLWSYDTVSRRLEIFSRGLTNPWGSTFDRWGQNFQTDGAGGGGIVYGFPDAVFYNSPLQKRELKGLNPNRPKSSGITILSGGHFPEKWRGSIVTSDFRANNMDRYTVEIDKSTYRSVVEKDLVASTRVTFRPIDTIMGPDGALYLADWYNPIIQHGEVDFRDNRRDQLHGRIWRITAKNRDSLKAPDYTNASINELLELLKAEGDWVRLNAKQALKDRDRDQVLTAIDNWVKQLDRDDTNYDHHLLEALWTMQTLKVVDQYLLRSVLGSNLPEARAAAVRVLSHWHKQIPATLDLLAVSVDDTSYQVRREAVTALGQLENSEAIEIATRVLNKPMDENMDFALWRTCRKLEPHWIPEFKQGKIGFNDDSGQLVFALQAIENTEVLNTLVDILNTRGVNAAPSIVRVIGRLGSAKNLDRLVDIASDSKHPLLESALLGLLDAVRERGVVPEQGTLKTLQNGLNSRSPKVVATACKLAGFWKEFALTTQMQELLTNPGSTDEIRHAAGEALTHLDSRKVRKFLRSLIRSDGGIESRLTAATTLTVLDLNAGADAVTGLLTEDLSRGQIEDLVRPVLIKHGAVEALSTALKGKAISAFVVTEVSQLLEVSGRESSALSLALRNAGNLSVDEYDDPRGGRTAELIRRLAEGDAKRGEVIYNMAQLACIDCHAIAGKGGTLGPDLDSIGASAPMDYIIRSIIEPSEKIKEGYRAVDIETKDSDFYSGSILREDEYSIFLRASANKEIQVLKNTIDTLETSTLSMMPSELTIALTDAEFLDLLAYLGSLGKN